MSRHASHRFIRTGIALGIAALMVVATAPSQAAQEGQTGPVTWAANDPSGAVRPVPGQVIRPFDRPTGPYGPGHRGVDLAATGGQVVHAALSGRISFSGQVARVGWVTVDHGGGLRTTYGPLTARVDTGVTIPAGAPIGVLDDAAVHLDWGAIMAGNYIDPLTLLSRWTLRLTTR